MIYLIYVVRACSVDPLSLRSFAAVHNNTRVFFSYTRVHVGIRKINGLVPLFRRGKGDRIDLGGISEGRNVKETKERVVLCR